MTNYLRNVWYVAAWEHEIEGSALLARTLLDVPRVMYRKSDGSGYVMLMDRCPHRFAPLSMGSRNGDAVACLYHGLEFGPNGACVHNPFSEVIPQQARVECTPTVAKYGLVWFWPGDPQRADPALIPDFSFLVGQNVWRRQSHFNGNYELLADNLMDLSHVDFLHKKTFNTRGWQADTVHEVREGGGDTLWSNYLLRRINKYPLLDQAYGPDEPVDQMTEMRWNAPATMALKISWFPSGGKVEEARVVIINPHIITPETAQSCHYFWSCEPNADAEAFARAVFHNEDRPMIEGVQARMAGADFWDLKPMILKTDLGAIRARRRLKRLISEERGERVTQDGSN